MIYYYYFIFIIRIFFFFFNIYIFFFLAITSVSTAYFVHAWPTWSSVTNELYWTLVRFILDSTDRPARNCRARTFSLPEPVLQLLLFKVNDKHGSRDYIRIMSHNNAWELFKHCLDLKRYNIRGAIRALECFTTHILWGTDTYNIMYCFYFTLNHEPGYWNTTSEKKSSFIFL